MTSSAPLKWSHKYKCKGEGVSSRHFRGGSLTNYQSIGVRVSECIFYDAELPYQSVLMKAAIIFSFQINIAEHQNDCLLQSSISRQRNTACSLHHWCIAVPRRKMIKDSIGKYTLSLTSYQSPRLLEGTQLRRLGELHTANSSLKHTTHVRRTSPSASPLASHYSTDQWRRKVAHSGVPGDAAYHPILVLVCPR